MTVLTVAMAVPWLGAALLALTARRLGRLLPPSYAVRLLAAAGLTIALTGGFTLAVLAFTLAAQNAWLARIGGWSRADIRLLDSLSDPIGLLAGLVVTALFVAALSRAVRTSRELWLTGLTCRRLGAGTEGLIVVEDRVPDAYALPGITGRIVVSTAMLQALSPAERRVLLAHESAHLRHHHYLYLLLADISAAANPLLRPAAAAVHLGVERWADEDAAVEVADRPLTARAVARAALARSAHQRDHRPATALDMATGPIVDRTRALLDPPPLPRRLLAAGLLALTLTTAVSAVIVERTTEHRFELAQSVVRQ